jgi:hypothetical protein
METAQFMATNLLEKDIELQLPEHQPLRQYIIAKKGKTVWSKIS